MVSSTSRQRRPPLRALAVFEAAARRMSFRFAAEELNLTPSAVSHHIKALELHLGHALFLRMNRALQLTPEGARYHRFVRDALERIDAGTLQLQTQPPAETLSVRAGSSFAQKWLLPRLPLFLAEHPHIDLLIDTRGPGGFFKLDEVDVHVRYGRPANTRASVEPLPEERILPLCSPALLRGPNPLREPRDLAKQTLIESEGSQIRWSAWLTGFHMRINPPRLRFDRSSLAIQAAVYGLGVALEGDFLASEELASGRLVTPFLLRDTAIKVPLRFLVIARAKLNQPKVQAFRHWVLREMGT
jgi:LysR family transcriptional regulator, glycine cleavage system transcriptional activator